MEKLAEATLSDGRLLEEKFKSADGIIYPGELDYRDFSSHLVRKVIYLQFRLSNDEAVEHYGEQKVGAFRVIARHFLTEIKDGLLTETGQREVSRQLKAIFPRLHLPKHSKK